MSTPAIEPVVSELPPGLTPFEAALRLADLPHLLILESAAFHPERGRYSFVSADPVGWRSVTDRRADFRTLFEQPARQLQEFRTVPMPDLPPFQGGFAGVFGYELNGTIERVPAARTDEFGLPLGGYGFYDWVIAFDHAASRAWVISTGYPETGNDRAQRAEDRLRFVLSQLERPPRPLPDLPSQPGPPIADQHPLDGHSGVTSNFDRPGYLAAVRRAIDYIHAGDCFQVNISQRLLARATDHPLALYGRCRERNAAPFAGYLDAGDHQIISASPERFVRADGRELSTRPIKGTRPRVRHPEIDVASHHELFDSEKDRAENVMIVDLLRNDFGRVCEFGSVRVPTVCEVETFRYVHHLVSEVTGRLRQECGPFDLLRAIFPGGSVTGAPKVRAMEIIAELEPTVRGPYCGSLGYVGFNGQLDTNILIRTLTVAGGRVHFPVGGGIVADSSPEAEYEETLHKAEGLLRALA